MSASSPQLQPEMQAPDEEREPSPSCPNDVKPPGLGWKYWVLFGTLCLSGFAVTMEGSIVVTALPTIARDLHTTDYVWVTNCYTLASAIFQPLIGWLAEVLGRKPIMLGSIVVFAIGSAMAGAANSLRLILAGRLIQGIGGGAIPLMAELIISDQLPLQQRPQMLGMVMATSCLGLVFGPILGGVIVNHSTWRWIFYLNLPLSGASLVCLFPVLGHRTAEQISAVDSLRVTAKQFDWVGNILLPTSSVAILLSLTMGGTIYAWNSARVIFPLVLGVCGLIAFEVYEYFCPHPLLPLRLLRNLSAVSLQIQSFIQSMLIMWVNYFLTIYFQAVLGLSPQQAGFELMPTIVAMVVFSIVGGILMSNLPGSWATLINLLAFAMMSIGLGCFTILTTSSPTVVHVVLQIIVAGGNGLLLATLLPNIQGHFDPKDMAAVTALFNFLRSFALVWGMTIPSIIFNQSVNNNLDQVPQEVRSLLGGGGAYVRASKGFMQSYHGTTKEQILGLYQLALRDTWWGAMAFALLAFVLVTLQRPVKHSTLFPKDSQQGESEKNMTQP
ncbi:Major facilitator superfamily domain general substrate transporter [Penicillium canescens]|uniref:Major facilitator superfamily domain general substrate transporter n=1 Tax=Penicillium canescens TaxID=5083 RepID=A0AAD6N594_PENCN|nr:Major facilitator superfamily domain general substrate transporter [Penicillium canescens]KAJ6034195.1 Major facilitator superfamily domain general substrate transporter [Penicillium canescens]KAJ6045857.1 Major facilitator superfamily domain general substrate transporter [Penicillium canescens]KAJ6052930.1 Major facilitator superfamily domain general substrate transporter [Penicillium canescens]KAJ6097027.1 Major facilitator superfamily domain general substrate transporter [Penicillium cane